MSSRHDLVSIGTASTHKAIIPRKYSQQNCNSFEQPKRPSSSMMQSKNGGFT